MKKTYSEIYDEFLQYNCKLITTEIEYDYLFDIQKIKVKNSKCLSTAKLDYTFQASCGHNRTASLNNLKKNKKATEWKCINCIRSESKIRPNTINNFSVEQESYNYLYNILHTKFYVYKTFNGCLTDILIKPLGIYQDEWLPLQIKATSICSDKGTYLFNINKNNYHNMIVICTYVKDDLIWLFNGSSISHLKRLGITDLIKTKYYNNKISNLDLNDALYQYYKENIYNVSVDKGNTPNSITLQKEQRFSKHREFLMKDYMFIKNLDDASCWDFVINNKKVQEKSHSNIKTIYGQLAYYFKIVKSCGRAKSQPYHEGDNDLYWFNLPNMKDFYIIPEKIMLLNNLLQTKLYKGKTVIKFTKNDQYENYLLNYNSLNKEKLHNLIK